MSAQPIYVRRKAESESRPSNFPGRDLCDTIEQGARTILKDRSAPQAGKSMARKILDDVPLIRSGLKSQAAGWSFEFFVAAAMHLSAKYERMRVEYFAAEPLQEVRSRKAGKAQQKLDAEVEREVWRRYVAKVRSEHPNWPQNHVHTTAQKRMIRAGVARLRKGRVWPSIVLLKKHAKSPKK